MTTDDDFITAVLERLQPCYPAQARRMFGGVGLYHDGRMFALIAENELYLKADDQNRQFFVELDLAPFEYQRNDGKVISMSYCQAPEAFFEDDDVTRLWSERAYAAACRAPQKKKSSRKKK